MLVAANITQLAMSIWCGQLLQEHNWDAATLAGVTALAVGIGGTLSLCSFAALHDLIHGTMVKVDKATREGLLFWMSFPTIFGYHLYLKRGHLSHHRNMGRVSLGQLFESSVNEFEDGDVLFVAHRQPLAGRAFEVQGLGLTFSPLISYNVFSKLWDSRFAGLPSEQHSSDPGYGARAIRNGLLYSFSMLFERFALGVNDKLVAFTGRNFFFQNKPDAFHEGCATYARTAALLHAALYMIAGPGSLLYLLVAEVAWQLPLHPACAMFVSNHGSRKTASGECVPTSSLYLGPEWGWYDWACIFTNYHLEHHDFPDIGLLKLPALKQLAPEFYSSEAQGQQDWLGTISSAFAEPERYACSCADGVDDSYDGEEDSAALVV